MDRLERVFSRAKREYFVSEDLKELSRYDMPVPIGFGQTNSQPATVRMMLEWLEVEPGNKILDVGSGSGWTTALLSYLTGAQGIVYAVEKIPELVEFGRANCQKLSLKNISFYKAGKQIGLPGSAPYDRILVSASAKELPGELLNQLKPGGKMVIPVVNDILEIHKPLKGEIEIETHPGFVFVPLV
jgi:protein-L-isoaspartate(D-aspartate) O-methyltransferase